MIKWPKNLRWWDGKKVTDAEKVVFIRTHLDKYGKFAISFNNQESVLSWSREPGIGPYIFNNKPFKKLTNNGLGYICTGEYEPISIGKTKLKLRKGKSIITFTTGKLPDDHPNKITFILGSEYSNTPWTRLPDKKISCKKSMSLPVVSLIDWDISKSPSNKRDFRIASTNLLPRGNIPEQVQLSWAPCYLPQSQSASWLQLLTKNTLIQHTGEPRKAWNSTGARRYSLKPIQTQAMSKNHRGAFSSSRFGSRLD